MLHKHHSTVHSTAVLLMLLGVSGALGGAGAFLGRKGTPLIASSQALPSGQSAEGSIRLEDRQRVRTRQRRVLREDRLKQNGRLTKDVGKTYPMQASALLPQQSSTLEVSLSAGYLSYPRLSIATPISKPSRTFWNQRDWLALERQMQFGLLYGTVAYPHSPEPGERGNLIIAGHSSAPTLEVLSSAYQDVFSTLPSARSGDRIHVNNLGEKPFTYEVYETQVVPAGETSILLQDSGRRDLILFTCYPVGTTKDRFVVKARLVDEGT